MGKPAARVSDKTAHGGAIAGPGVPTVIIGGLPAAVLGDNHECPKMAGPVPHVGGMIAKGSQGVSIGGKPAARAGDVVECKVGGSHAVAAGCATVLIGDAGAGSRDALRPVKDVSSEAGLPDPAGISLFPVAPPEPPPESLHCVRFRFVDASGRPLPGIPFRRGVPGGGETPGMTDAEGEARYAGLAMPGSYAVTVGEIAAAKWAAREGEMGSLIGFSARADGFPDGTKVTVSFLECSENGDRRFLENMIVEVQDGRIRGEWRIVYAVSLAGPGPMAAGQGLRGIRFVASCENAVAVSGMLRVLADFSAEVVDASGRPLADSDVAGIDPDGRQVRFKTDALGRIRGERMPAGFVRFPAGPTPPA